MTVSKIDICNLALAIIGEDAIRDFDEGNKRARMCYVFYTNTRDMLLGQFNWPFARRQMELARLATAPDWAPEGTYAYALPSDCLMPIDLWPEGTFQEWEVRSNTLYCKYHNEEVPIVLIYTRREVNYALYSTSFVNLLSLALAVKLSPPLTQDKELTKTLGQQYEIAKLNAWGTDANIGNRYKHSDDDPNRDSFVDADYAVTSGFGDVCS